jgi:hypothetical protein
MPALVFEKASLLCYRMFDIAAEIRLEALEPLLAQGAARVKLTREGSQYLMLPNPPAVMKVGLRPFSTRGLEVQVEVTVRLFDHGAASVEVEVPVPPGTTFDEVVVLADELYDSAALDGLALEMVEGVRRRVAPALERSHLWEQSESYTILFAERIQGAPNAQEVLDRADLARLLLGEVSVRSLSGRERREVTQAQFSYSEDDLAVVDWNAAFVYEPSGSRDIPHILEICNAQLLELRYYDDLLDRHIKATYDELQRPRKGLGGMVRSPYRVLLHKLQVTLLELNEFTERVENSLKIIGDFYLAKVYEGAVARLRIPNWQAAVTRKEKMLGNVGQLLKGEVDTARSLMLEVFIAVLIIVELAVAAVSLVRH